MFPKNGYYLGPISFIKKIDICWLFKFIINYDNFQLSKVTVNSRKKVYFSNLILIRKPLAISHVGIYNRKIPNFLIFHNISLPLVF